MDEKKQIEEMGFIIQENSPLSKISSEDVAESLYNAGYRRQEWISVEERLPELYDSVLTYSYNDYCRECWLDEDYDWHTKETAYDFEEMTHWMPLPEAPKMKGGAE